jgi:hypothetical protein
MEGVRGSSPLSSTEQPRRSTRIRIGYGIVFRRVIVAQCMGDGVASTTDSRRLTCDATVDGWD